MNARVSRCTVAPILAFTLGFSSLTRLHADITYSWSGRLALFSATDPDPWLIGQGGTDFVIQTTVDDSASDINSTQIPYAAFVPSAVRLWVNNDEATFVGSSNIDFTDTEDIIDIITAGGKFMKMGSVIDISSVVGLPPSTFTFAFPSETPPFFASPTISLGPATSVQHPYLITVQSGTLVTVTPEPTGFLLSLTAFAMLSGRRMACNR